MNFGEHEEMEKLKSTRSTQDTEQQWRRERRNEVSKGNKRCFPDVFVIHFVLYLLTLYLFSPWSREICKSKGLIGRFHHTKSEKAAIHSWTKRAIIIWLRTGILWFSSSCRCCHCKWEKISSLSTFDVDFDSIHRHFKIVFQSFSH